MLAWNREKIRNTANQLIYVYKDLLHFPPSIFFTFWLKIMISSFFFNQPTARSLLSNAKPRLHFYISIILLLHQFFAKMHGYNFNIKEPMFMRRTPTFNLMLQKSCVEIFSRLRVRVKYHLNLEREHQISVLYNCSNVRKLVPWQPPYIMIGNLFPAA